MIFGLDDDSNKGWFKAQVKRSLDPVCLGFEVRAVVVPVGSLDVFGARGKRS